MLYTGKGDSGETSLFACSQKVAKGASVIEALGTLDELNSWLGVCRTHCQGDALTMGDTLKEIQQNLFIIQAELAGVPKTISILKVKTLEKQIKVIEKKLPPIHSFFLPGGSELGARLDYARTVARRAERRAVGEKIGPYSLAYLNRLSSFLYALARLANHKSGIKEEPPHYR